MSTECVKFKHLGLKCPKLLIDKNEIKLKTYFKNFLQILSLLPSIEVVHILVERSGHFISADRQRPVPCQNIKISN